MVAPLHKTSLESNARGRTNLEGEVGSEIPLGTSDESRTPQEREHVGKRL